MSIVTDIVSDIVSDPVIDIVGAHGPATLDDLTFIARGSAANLTLTSDDSHAGQAVYVFAVMDTSDDFFFTVGHATSNGKPNAGLGWSGQGGAAHGNGMGSCSYYKNGASLGSQTRDQYHDNFSIGSKVLTLIETTWHSDTAPSKLFPTTRPGGESFVGTVYDGGIITQAEVASKMDLATFQSLLMAANGL